MFEAFVERGRVDRELGECDRGRHGDVREGRLAEFERAMIRERTSAGLAAARAEGRVGGRRKKLDVAKRREIAESVITGRQRPSRSVATKEGS